MRKTYFTKETDAVKDWYVIDATDMVLGRLATRVANVLRGKHKPMFTPNVDTGDNIIIINAEKIKLTGNKLTQKLAFRHTGFPGGAKFVRYDKLMAETPERSIIFAVRGMLPKNKLRDRFMKKLHVYKGIEHPHEAQRPKSLDVMGMK
ncbi:MAG: 50S ribosomal protein L13 [bacterium]|nr:50S ribosomal protein L13 [bacterium]